jgi:hypothetical protein
MIARVLPSKKKMTVLDYFVDDIGFSYPVFYFHSDALTCFCSLDLFVFYLHGVDRLFNVCGGSFDADSVANRYRSRQFYDCHAYLCEEM